MLEIKNLHVKVGTHEILKGVDLKVNALEDLVTARLHVQVLDFQHDPSFAGKGAVPAA